MLTKEEIQAKIAGMSKDEMIKVALHQLEIERRRREELISSYVPYDNPGYQLDFHKSRAPIRLAVGGNKSGKTYPHCAEHIWWATGTHPYQETPPPPVHLRWVTTDFRDGLMKVALPMFRSMVRSKDLLGGSWEKAYSKELQTLFFADGSTEEFMTYEQEADKFGGVDRHVIGFDEPPPYDIYNENIARTMKFKGRITMTLTPVNLNARTSWISDFYLDATAGQNKSVEVFEGFDTRNNRSLDKIWLEDFFKQFPEDQRMTRMTGQFPMFAGKVFKTFSRAKHVISPFEINENYTVYLGIDPHTRTETAVLFYAVNREEQRFVFDELFEHGSARLIIDAINTKLRKLKPEKVVMDASAKAPNQYLGGKSILQEFLDPAGDGSRKGIFAIPVKTKPNEVIVGIRQIDYLLGLDEMYQKPQLFTFENCPLTIREFETCIWDDYRHKIEKPLLERIKKKGIHFIDCIRMLEMSGVPYVKVRFDDPEAEYKNPYAFLNQYRGVGV